MTKVKHDELLTDEESASIVVKVRGLPVRALLDTGARVNVMDIQTMRELGVSHCLNTRVGQVYGVAGTPVAIVGIVEIPIELRDRDTRLVQVTSWKERNKHCSWAASSLNCLAVLPLIGSRGPNPGAFFQSRDFGIGIAFNPGIDGTICMIL